MRVLHVSDAYLPHLGGIENLVADLAARQAAAGHDVTVLTTTPAGAHEAPGHAGSGVHVLRWTGARGLVSPARAVRDLLRDGGWEVVHCHASVLSPLARRLALSAASVGVPTAVTVHSMWSAAGPLLTGTAALLGLRGRPIAWSAVSAVAAAPVRRALGPGTVVTVLPNAVDVGWWRRAEAPALASTEPAGQSAGGAAEPVRVVRVTSVLRMSVRKRPLPALRIVAAARRLLPDSVNLQLTLAGDGPRMAAARAHIDRHEMTPFVRLAGRLDRAEVRSLLARSDLYLAPADFESFGIAALEARAVGLPVIAKRRGGVADFVAPDSEGLLEDTDRDMARALADLATDHGRREAITAHNTAHPPVYDWPKALTRASALYARAEHIAAFSRASGGGRAVPAPEAAR